MVTGIILICIGVALLVAALALIIFEEDAVYLAWLTLFLAICFAVSGGLQCDSYIEESNQVETHQAD